jgi:opacity protein-like surface antigen
MQDQDFACKYTGFDVNVGVGYSVMTVDNSISDPNIAEWKNDLGAGGVSVQGRVGGTYGFCERWIIGLDGYAQYNNLSHKFSGNAPALTYEVSEKEAIQANYGVDARVGVVGSPSNMYYLTAGPDWGYFKSHRTSTLAGITHTYSDTHLKLGGRVGGGAEQMFGDHWVIKEQFSYSWFGSQSYTHPDGATVTYTTKLGTMLFIVGYLF